MLGKNGGIFLNFRLICYQKPYLKKIRTKIKATREGFVLLEENIFFPGAGGQSADVGYINGMKIKGSQWIGDELWLEIPEHSFTGKEEVLLEIEWSMRYKLMKAHTAEHLLLRALANLSDGSISLHKIEISHTSAKVMVNGMVKWSEVLKAMEIVNQWINNHLQVEDKILPISEAKNIPNIRARWERITDSHVRVVSINPVDVAACKGLHVHDTSEIRLFSIRKVNHETKSGKIFTLIEFVVDNDALQDLLRQQHVIAELRGLFPTTPLKNIPKTIKKIIQESEMAKKSLKSIFKQVITRHHEMKITNDTTLIVFEFKGVIPRILSRMVRRRIDKIKTKVIIVLLGMDLDNKKLHFQIFKTKELQLNLSECLERTTSGHSWKGGGSDASLFGFVEWEDTVHHEKFVQQFKEHCKSCLKSE